MANVVWTLEREVGGVSRRVQPTTSVAIATLPLAVDEKIESKITEPLLLDEKRAAEYLGVSLSYLRKSRSEGSPGNRTPPPPFVKIDGRVFYRCSDLDQWVAGLEARWSFRCSAGRS